MVIIILKEVFIWYDGYIILYNWGKIFNDVSLIILYWLCICNFISFFGSVKSIWEKYCYGYGFNVFRNWCDFWCYMVGFFKIYVIY